MKLENKVIAITGAGGIICSAFAKALAEEGAKVALLDINYDAAKQFADEIGENAIAIRCNCLDKESISKKVKLLTLFHTMFYIFQVKNIIAHFFINYLSTKISIQKHAKNPAF